MATFEEQAKESEVSHQSRAEGNSSSSPFLGPGHTQTQRPDGESTVSWKTHFYLEAFNLPFGAEGREKTVCFSYLIDFRRHFEWLCFAKASLRSRISGYSKALLDLVLNRFFHKLLKWMKIGFSKSDSFSEFLQMEFGRPTEPCGLKHADKELLGGCRRHERHRAKPPELSSLTCVFFYPLPGRARISLRENGFVEADEYLHWDNIPSSTGSLPSFSSRQLL